MAAGVAVISSRNHLLYICTAECPDPLYYHFKIHSALDVIENKWPKRSAPNDNQEPVQQYLGLLYPMEEHKIYGYVTNTQIKFIMIFESHAQVLSSYLNSSNNVISARDADIVNMFQQLNKAYINLISSPFYKPGSAIDPESLPAAARFDKFVREELLAKRANSGYCTTLSNLISTQQQSE